MCRFLGDLLQEGVVLKIADDLYVGGDTPIELADNWERVLYALDKANLRASAIKTIIAPLEEVPIAYQLSLLVIPLKL